MNSVFSWRLPSWRTPVWFWGVSCAVFAVALEIWPALLGQVFAWTAELLGLASFLAAHPAVYACVRFTQWLAYSAGSLAALDAVFIFFTYKILDELVTRQAEVRGLIGLSLRTLPRLFVLQALAGLLCAGALALAGAFSPMALFPSPFAAQAGQAFIFAVWLGGLAWFCCAFAVKENLRGALGFGRDLLRAHKLFWCFCVLWLFAAAWLPAWLAEALGVVSSGGRTGILCMIAAGLVNTLVAYSVCLTYFFNRPDAFAVEEDA